jgi:hypothetical protein
MAVSVHGQAKLHVLLDYRHLRGWDERGVYDFPKAENMYGNSLRLTCLYKITGKWSTGLGIGADRYENPGYNTFPIFIPVHFHPFVSFPMWYALMNAGYALKGVDAHTGLTWDIGVGYKKMFRKHAGINLQLGYNLKQFNLAYRTPSTPYGSVTLPTAGQGQGHRTRHSLFFGVGYAF